MGDIDQELRERFRSAADGAPQFRGLREPVRPARARWVAVLAAATVVLVALGGGVGWWASRDDDPPVASCPAALRYDGRTYLGTGGLERTPRAGQRLGTATRPSGCDQEEPDLAVFALGGVSPRDVVLAEDSLWVRKGLTTLPSEVVALRRPVACQEGGVVRGELTGVDGSAATTDGEVEPPYTAELRATAGTAVDLRAYLALRVLVRVTDQTMGADRQTVTRALAGRPVAVEVRCRGESFEAVRISLVGG